MVLLESLGLPFSLLLLIVVEEIFFSAVFLTSTRLKTEKPENLNGLLRGLLHDPF